MLVSKDIGGMMIGSKNDLNHNFFLFCSITPEAIYAVPQNIVVTALSLQCLQISIIQNSSNAVACIVCGIHCLLLCDASQIGHQNTTPAP